METNPSTTSPVPSTSRTSAPPPPVAAAAEESTNADDVAEATMRVFRLLRTPPETLIRGTQTGSLPSEPSTSNASEPPDEASTSAAAAVVAVESPPPENPRKVILVLQIINFG